MQIIINNVTITTTQSDITKWQGDIIVNASNSGLFGGGGVDGAIHRAGGPRIAEECALIRQKQGGCLPGEAALTTAGMLSARFIIHTVGPIWKGGGGGEVNILAKCYRNSLELACSREAHSIAFPNISTGIYRFPKVLASKTAIETVIQYVQEHQSEALSLRNIDFICYDRENAELYVEELKNYN
ncbi:MAG: macro domain-containing protein [Paenibacillus sp.]|nr:macro domain-containing protein [Paenibacillus sp.]